MRASKLLLLLLLAIFPACTVQMGDETTTVAPNTTPRILVSTELADYTLEAGNDWAAATLHCTIPYAPTMAVADDVDAEADQGDWTVVAVDHVDSCTTDSDPDPRGCTIGGPTTIRKQEGIFVYEGTTVSAHKRIEIRRDMTEGNADEIVSTIMHEIGHALNLKHLPEGLMNPDRTHNERINPLVDKGALAAYEAATSVKESESE